jgi:hypothetical protein
MYNAMFPCLCNVKFAESPSRRLTDGDDAPLPLPEAEQTHPATLCSSIFSRRQIAESHAGRAHAK